MLALKYHPDKNDALDSEETFKKRLQKSMKYWGIHLRNESMTNLVKEVLQGRIGI